MPPASPLAIATSSVKRLVKEEASYHRELEQQTKRLQQLESEDANNDDEGNRPYLLKQEVCLPCGLRLIHTSHEPLSDLEVLQAYSL